MENTQVKNIQMLERCLAFDTDDILINVDRRVEAHAIKQQIQRGIRAVGEEGPLSRPFF